MSKNRSERINDLSEMTSEQKNKFAKNGRPIIEYYLEYPNKIP